MVWKYGGMAEQWCAEELVAKYPVSTASPEAVEPRRKAARRADELREQAQPRTEPPAADAQAVLEVLPAGVARQPGALLEALIRRQPDKAWFVAKHIASENLGKTDSQGLTALHHAVRRCYLSVVRVLVGRAPWLAGVTSAATGKPSHWTPLHVVCDLLVAGGPAGAYERECIAEALHQHMGADAVNEKTAKGNTALHHAASRGHVGLVNLLLQGGKARVNEVNHANKTPLDNVARSHGEIADKLTKSGGRFQGPHIDFAAAGSRPERVVSTSANL